MSWGEGTPLFMANGFDFCGIGSYCYICKTKKDSNDYILTKILLILLRNRETLVSPFILSNFLLFFLIPSLFHFPKSLFKRHCWTNFLLIVMGYGVPLIHCTLVFLATYAELLHFEVSLDLEGYCFSCGFLSGNSIVCDNDAKQAESCLRLSDGPELWKQNLLWLML